MPPVLPGCLRILQGIGLGANSAARRRFLCGSCLQAKARAFLDVAGQPRHSRSAGLLGEARLSAALERTVSANWRVAPSRLLSAVIAIPALLARYKLPTAALFERVKQREQVYGSRAWQVSKRTGSVLFCRARVCVPADVTAFQRSLHDLVHECLRRRSV